MTSDVVRRDNTWSFYYQQASSVQGESAQPTSSSVTYGPHVRTDSFTGGKNPRYRADIRNGVNAATTMSGARYRFSVSKGDASVSRFDVSTGKTVTYTTSGDFTIMGDAILAVSLLPSSSADTTALQSLYKHIRKTYQHVQTGVTVGEWKETWKMMRNAAKTVRRAVDDYVRKARREAKAMERDYRRRERARRGIDPEKGAAGRKAKDLSRKAAAKAAAARKEAHAKAVNKRISDLWLEFSFGIKPTLSDVKAHAEALARMSEKSYRTRVYGQGEVADSPYQQYFNSVANTYIHYRKFRRVDRLTTVRYVAGYEERSYSSVGEQARDVFGFTPEDFVPTVYELIPYSWLLDYFTNVGDVLSAAFTQLKSVKWIVKTTRQGIVEETSAVVRHDFIKQILGQNYRGSSGHCGSERQEVWQISRSPIGVGALPLPSLRLEWVPTDDLRWLNLGALGNSRRA